MKKTVYVIRDKDGRLVNEVDNIEEAIWQKTNYGHTYTKKKVKVNGLFKSIVKAIGEIYK